MCYVHCWCVHNTLLFLQCLPLPAKLMMITTCDSMEDVTCIIMKDPVPCKGYPQLKCSYHQYHDICIYSAHIHFSEALLYSICYMLLFESTEIGFSNHHQLRRSRHILSNARKCRCALYIYRCHGIGDGN